LQRLGIEFGEQAKATLLAYYRGQTTVRACRGAGERSVLAAAAPGRVDAGVRLAGGGAAVRVGGFNSTVAVNRDLVEVDHVSAGVAAALHPDTTAMDRVFGRSADAGPGLETVVRECHIEDRASSE